MVQEVILATNFTAEGETTAHFLGEALGERGLRVTRRVANVPPPAHWAGARPFAPDARFDRWFVYDFVLPGTLLMQSGGRPVEDAEGDMRHAVELHSCQTLTPETETSTHYFFQQAHRPSLGGEQLTRTLYDSLIVAFNEDRDMITAQARNIEHAPLLPMPVSYTHLTLPTKA